MIKMEATIDFSTLSFDYEQKLVTYLDLENFNSLIEEAQEKQIIEGLNELESELVVSAYNFLSSLKEAQKIIKEAEMIATKLRTIRDGYILEKGQSEQKQDFSKNINFTGESFFSNYNEANEYMTQLFNKPQVKELYKKADIFNDKLIQTLTKGKKKLKTIIAVKGKEGHPILYEVDMGKYIDERMKMRYSSGIPRLSANFNLETEGIANKLESLTKLENENDYTNLNKTYREVYNRYSSHKTHYVMQKIKDKQKKAKIVNSGDITEAYAYFQFSNKYKFTGSKEKNVDTYVMKGIVNVDSISGMYQGDISLKDDIYDYAIKQGNASFLELVQMVNLTQDILLAVKNKQSLKKVIKDAYKAELKKNKNVTRTEISDAAEKEVKEIMEKNLKKT